MAILSDITSVNKYLKQLTGDRNFLIAISVSNLDLSDDICALQNSLADMGFKTDILKSSCSSFIGVIDKGDIVYETVGYNHSECFSYRSDTIELTICNSFKNNNSKTKILVDGTDFSAKADYINIVVCKNGRIYDALGFQTSKKGFTIKKAYHDAALVGCWWGANYGSILNGYAVYMILRSLNISVLMLHKHDTKEKDWEIYGTHNSRFIEEIYPPADISPNYSFNELDNLNNHCDIFITGSDQVWNYGINRLFKYVFMLNFVNEEKKKISFGTSFGHAVDTTPNDKHPFIKNLLKRYNAISVREHFSADILHNNYGINSQVTIEPVFCLDKKDYDILADMSEMEVTDSYILCYILDPTPQKKEAIEYYAKATGKKYVIILDGDPRFFESNKKKIGLNCMQKQPLTQDFIKLFKNTDFVITDSFHGTAFSIIYNKPFLAISNRKRGERRFKELLEIFDMTDRLAADPYNIPLDKRFTSHVDFTKANAIIKKKSQEAVRWLDHVIRTPKNKLPDVKISDDTLTYKPPVSDSVRSIYSDSESLLQFDSYFMRFRFNPGLWEQHRINGVETLFTKQAKPPSGSFAVMPLYKGLRQGQSYRFSSKFKVRTLSANINFYIGNSDKKARQVIRTYCPGDNKNENDWVVLIFDFIPDTSVYNEFMIEASQISGSDSYISFAFINITSIK